MHFHLSKQRVSLVLFAASLFLLINTAHAVPTAKNSSRLPQATSFSDLPSGAAPAIARVMAQDLPQEYQLRRTDDSYSMANPSHGINIAFTPEGPDITSGNTDWAVTLSGIGYKGSVKQVQEARLIQDNTRMVYERGNVSEWYVNSRWGVEQGFTIEQAPTTDKNGRELIVELSISGDVQLSLAANSVELTDAQGIHIARYTGLRVFDADSNTLPARLDLVHNTLRILVNDTGATYPVTIDPWIQSAKLTTSDGAVSDKFGWSVAISGDTIVVGAYFDDDKDASSGSAYIFAKPASGWANMTETAKLTSSDGAASDFFGYSVAISGDTVVVGAHGEDDNGSYSGSVYVFAKPENGWVKTTETARLNASDGAAEDFFGRSVAISGDTIVVGAYLDDDNGESSGSAYVFVKPGSGWANMTETAKITAGDGTADDRFGYSVAISDDTIVVGAFFDDDNGENSGSAYVFAKPESSWVHMTQTAKLTAGDGAVNDMFGWSVAIGGDTVVVGAYHDDDNGESSGSAYVFAKPESYWSNMTQTAKLTAGDGAASDWFGYSVAISGNTIVVGAYFDDDNGENSGSAYVFAMPGSSWTNMTETAKITAIDGATDDRFGRSVAISGFTVIVGAPGDDDNGAGSGSADVFDIDKVL